MDKSAKTLQIKASRVLLVLAVLVCSIASVVAMADSNQSDIEVCLFSKSNFQGEQYCTKSNKSFVPLWFSAKSVRIPPGYRLRAYKLPFFLGGLTVFERSRVQLTAEELPVRSFRLEPKESTLPLGKIVPIITFLMNDVVDPNDYDGDGYSNELEDEYGSNPHDPNSTPPDIDGDKIPDDIDPDRDGDGIPNDLEEENLTDPNDPNDYPDLVKPVLFVDNPTSILTTSATIDITGNLIDPLQPYSGIKSFFIHSDQYLETEFQGMWDSSTGAFSIQVPLKFGNNQLKVKAIDHAGNTSMLMLAVKRSAVPQFEDLQPISGSVTESELVAIRGKIRTGSPVNDFKLSFNGSYLTPTPLQEIGLYEFSVDDFQLELGTNIITLSVLNEVGGDHENLSIRYEPEAADEFDAPSIIGIAPADNSTLNQDSFHVSAQIESFAGPLRVLVDGQELLAPSLGRESYTVSREIKFPDGESSVDVTIEAWDSLGQQTKLTLNYVKDDKAPIISLNLPIVPLPTINTVTSAEVRVSGMVSDTNLSSVTLNDVPLRLSPGTEPGVYIFDTLVVAPYQSDAPNTVVAVDQGGNVDALEFVVSRQSNASISSVLPPADATFVYRGEPITLQVVARVEDTETGYTAYVYIQSDRAGTARQMSASGDLRSTDLVLPRGDRHQIVFELRDGSGSVVATALNQVNVATESDIPLDVVRVEPGRDSSNVEPNAPIEIYFNREVDADLIDITVKETLHGPSYINLDPLGEDFIRSKGYTLQNINRDLEAVSGQVSLMPDSAGIVFAPDRHYGFNGTIYVELNYASERLMRTQFNVRELPTFVDGAVSDQFGRPLAGLSVRLKELDKETKTNRDGGFAFGYQESGEQTIPAGEYTVVVNEGLENPAYGVYKSKVHVEQNRPNRLPKIQLAELSSSVPFYLLRSNALNNVLDDDLILDLSQAKLFFPDSRRQGNAHFQFLTFEHLGVNMYPAAMPHWMFEVQPKGIQIEGKVSLSIKIPQLRGSYDYINPEVYQYVVLLGFSEENQIVEPVGVGQIVNSRVQSVGKLHLTSLDYLGYALVLPSLTPRLIDYADGKTSLTQLKATLQEQGISQ